MIETINIEQELNSATLALEDVLQGISQVAKSAEQLSDLTTKL